MPDPPALLLDGAREALDDLTRAIQNREHEIAAIHLDVFRRYRDDLEYTFLQHSEVPLPQAGADPVVLHRQWDWVALRRDNALAVLQESFQALTDALYAQQQESFAESLALAAEDGFLRELWLLAEGGLDVEPYFDAAPEDWSGVVAANTHDGIDWDARLLMWGALTRDKLRRWLGASAMSGSTWEDTVAGYSRITGEHTGHIVGLFENEMVRAFLAGGAVALLAARQDDPTIVEVWVSRLLWGDQTVCPLCKAKHLTVTQEQPVDDSHPGCRCIKVPVPGDYVPTPIPYTSFVGDRT